ncbi:unnamed protein product [Prorocentrum cordatum]|uniref:Uncharacterized protein n=1 Tax=Prorocentrum cordatum TaxID=2364126 RepID=A0ABN9R2V6_9DINO|nr:unnamed protein product [Polarella glacialis]
MDSGAFGGFGVVYVTHPEGPGRGPHVPRFGSYIRGRPRRGMRETPTKVVFRHPETWGFVLDSCWAVHTSWPLPRRGQDPSLEDSALPMTVENMHSEAQRYNRGQQIDPEDPDPVDDGFEVGLEYRGEDDSLGRLVRVRMGDQALHAAVRDAAGPGARPRARGGGRLGRGPWQQREEEWEAEGAGGSAESELGGGTP